MQRLVPLGRIKYCDGNIVNNGGNVVPVLNRGEHDVKPANSNKPDKPENSGTEDKVDKNNKITHIYTYDDLNQLVCKTTTNNEVYTYSYDKRIAETGKKASQSLVNDATNCMVEGTHWKGDKSAYSTSDNWDSSWLRW